MNIFTLMRDRLMNLFSIKTESLTELTSYISSEMLKKIQLWSQMVESDAEWQRQKGSCGLLTDIASTIARPVSEELKVKATDEANESLTKAMNKLNDHAADIVTHMALRGSCLVRPVYANGKMQFELLPLGNYLPTSYDFDGTLTGAKILKYITENKQTYLLIEEHQYDGVKKTHTVTLRLYLDDGKNKITEVPLSRCKQTAEMTTSYMYTKAEMPFVIEIRNRDPNNIDGSCLPVPLYSNNETLIKDADEAYSELKWEMKAGKTKVFADADMFRARQGDEAVCLPSELQDVVIKYEGNGTAESKIQTHSPALRVTDYINGFNKILQRVEAVCKLGKGSLSDLTAVEQTATQYTGGKAVTYHTVDSFESELEAKYRDIAYVFWYMLSAYEPENRPSNADITITYNDSARKDPDKMRQSALLEVQNGIISEAEYRMRIFGEDEATAMSKVPEKPVMDGFGLGLQM